MATDWALYPQLYLDGVWTIIEPAEAQGLTIERGVAEDGDIKPGSMSWRIIDDDDRYRPTNVASDLYGVMTPTTRQAAAVSGSIRFTGQTDRVMPGQTDDFHVGPPIRGYRWVDLQAAGSVGLLGRWRDPLSSPMFTQLSSYANLRDYWPMEDGRDATQLTNVRAGGEPGYAVRADLAAEDGPPGSAPLVAGRTDSTIGARFSSNVSTTGWQIHWVAYVGSTGAGGDDTFTFRTTAGVSWRWRVSSTTYMLRVTDADGSTVAEFNYSFGGNAAPGQWITTRLKCYQSGGNVTIEAGWNPVNTSSLYGFTETYAGTLGRPVAWNIPGNATVDASVFGHVLLVNGTTDNLQSPSFQNAFNGYAGETAANRFGRLLNAAGIPWQLRGTLADSAPMGPQPIATLQELIKQCRETEDGLIFDRADNRGIVFATRAYLIDQAVTPALTLAWPDQIGQGLQEEITTADIFNDVTVTDATGTSARASLATGSPLAADGELGKLPKTVDVNVSDPAGQLDPLAGWWLNRYTVGSSRYPTMRLDYDDQPALEASFNALDIGMVIAVTGRTPETLYLQVRNILENVQRFRRTLTLTLAPADVLRAGVYNTTRYDVQGSTVDVAVNATTTAVPVDNTSMHWGTQTPYYVMIGGERMIVTAVAGTGASQTLTVVRSTNGIVKSHPAGTPVHIGTNPGRYAP